MLEQHKLDMLELPLRRCSMDDRIDYAVEQCKEKTIYLRENPE